MRLQNIQVCLLLLCSVLTTGSSSQKRFIQTNRDLLMTVTQAVQIGKDIFLWRFKDNSNKNIVRLVKDEININKDYNSRVEFFQQNLSLILKNVQLSDSGIYTADVFGDQEETVASYDVTVQAPVSPVSLSVASVSNSSDSCNFTVSCKTEDSSINSISHTFTCNRSKCNKSTCEEPRPLTPDRTNYLRLCLSNKFIICNHSNLVSWENDTKEIRQLCPLFGDTDSSGFDKSTGVKYEVIGGVIGAAGACVFLSVVGLVVYRKRKKDKMVFMENTVYAPVEQSPRRAPGTDVLLSKGQDASTIYSEVQPHSAPFPAPASVMSENPESLYTTVKKPQSSE